MLTQPIPEMSAKKIIFRMENCGNLPAEVCGVLEHFVHKSTQAGNFFCADVCNISICRSAVVHREVCGHQCGHLCRHLCGHPHGWVRTSAWMGADVCGSLHGRVRTSAGPKGLLELLPLLCNNLLIICGIT